MLLQKFRQDDGDEYASSPVEQPGTHTRIGSSCARCSSKAGKTVSFKVLISFRLAKKCRDVDQKFLRQNFRFSGGRGGASANIPSSYSMPCSAIRRSMRRKIVLCL